MWCDGLLVRASVWLCVGLLVGAAIVLCGGVFFGALGGGGGLLHTVQYVDCIAVLLCYVQ
jgi:hypothetical protein